MNLSPIVYLPIEFASREFDGKAFLAATLAMRGYSVLFGEQWSICENVQHLPRGSILFKSFNKFYLRQMRAAKESGHKVFVLEEELFAHTEKKAIANFYNSEAFQLPDAIFANGEFEKDALTELGGDQTKIEVAGNPRVDILKPVCRSFFQRDMDAIRARFGNFVLVNTNFGITNSVTESLEQVTKIHIKAGFVKPDGPESLQAWADQIEFEHKNKAAIIAVVKDLAQRRPKLKIVVRPHPAESLLRWNGVFDDMPNVAIVREGAHVSWTLASAVLLHTSCTTGLEAYAAGKAAISLVAAPNWISQSFISNQVNPVFATPKEIVDATELYLEGGAVAQRSRLTPVEAECYIWNIGDKSAVQRISDLLTASLPISKEKIPLPQFVTERSTKQKEKLDLSLAQCADILRRIFDIIGQERPLKLDRMGDSLFYLYPEAAL